MAAAVSEVNGETGPLGRAPRSAWAIALLFLGVSTVARAQAEGPRTASGAALEAVRYLRDDYLRGVGGVASGTYLGTPAVAIAVAGALVPVLDDHDEEIRGTIRRRRPLGSAGASLGEGIGRPGALFAYPVAAAALGYATGRPELSATARAMVEALSVASGSTFVLKLAVGRERPDRSDRLSFPSNHAAGSFALAATIAGRHGWVPGVPAVALAAFAAYARLEQDKHFFTDTLFGAVLGSAAGWAAAESASRPPAAAPAPPRSARSWRLVPALFSRGGGIAAFATW